MFDLNLPVHSVDIPLEFREGCRKEFHHKNCRIPVQIDFLAGFNHVGYFSYFFQSHPFLRNKELRLLAGVGHIHASKTGAL